METQTAYKPRVVRGRTELWVPHNGGEIAFAHPSTGPGTYINVGKQILESNQLVPTGDYTASLLHSAYGCTEKAEQVMNEPEFIKVRETMKNRWLWIYNKNLWTPTGVYVLQDTDATGRNKPLDVKDLEKMLEGGEELSWGGIRFSKDKKVRFAPKGSYTLGEITSEQFAKDGLIVTNSDVEGAEKLGEVSAKFRNQPYIYGIEVQEGQEPEQKVSAVVEGGGRLRFGGNDWGDDDVSHAFGVWK